MRIAITSSSREQIDDTYKEESRKIIEYLANQGYELNWGAGDRGIMGICYDEFDKRGNKIYGYTTSLYVYMLDNLKNATHVICDDTFELKKGLFTDSDAIICLPGGIGTISEIFTYLEEIRSNGKEKKIIICNINGWFNKYKEALDESINNNFIDESINNSFIITNSIEEIKKALE